MPGFLIRLLRSKTRWSPFPSLILAAFAIGVSGCTPADRTANDSTTGGKPQFRMALITPGPISDKSWNGSAYQGLLAVRDSLGASISHIQTSTPAEFEENFRQYGAQGYDLVIGHGFEFHDAAARVASSYPKTVFVVTSGRIAGPNVAGISFEFEEVTYEAGMIAAALSKSGVLGLIAGTEFPPVKASFIAFERGARKINPNVRTLESYIGNWEDVSAGKELALAQIARGADVIFQNADAAGLGVIQAVKEKNVLAFGTNANQNDVAPDVIVGSVVVDQPKAFLLIAREVQSGTFKGRVIQLGLAEDVVRLEMNSNLASRIPAAVKASVDSVSTLLRANNFHELDDVLAGADSAKSIPAPRKP